MAVITDEEESAAVQEIELHADQAICVTREVMKSDALTEIHRSLVKCFPIQ